MIAVCNHQPMEQDFEVSLLCIEERNSSQWFGVENRKVR